MDGGRGVAEGGIGDEVCVRLEGMAHSRTFYKEEGEEKTNGRHHADNMYRGLSREGGASEMTPS